MNAALHSNPQLQPNHHTHNISHCHNTSASTAVTTTITAITITTITFTTTTTRPLPHKASLAVTKRQQRGRLEYYPVEALSSARPPASPPHVAESLRANWSLPFVFIHLTSGRTLLVLLIILISLKTFRRHFRAGHFNKLWSIN